MTQPERNISDIRKTTRSPRSGFAGDGRCLSADLAEDLERGGVGNRRWWPRLPARRESREEEESLLQALQSSGWSFKSSPERTSRWFAW